MTILHAVPAADWNADPDRPLAPPSLGDEGFVHCSRDEQVTLAVVDAFYRDAPRPLLVLEVDEALLSSPVRWEAASPAPPPGVADDVLFPHVLGPIDRAAVVAVHEVVWDADGRPTGLRPVG